MPVREQRECSLHEAKHIVWKEELHARLAAAITVDDLRPVLAALIDRTSQWTTPEPFEDEDETEQPK
jgi:hypothetical protein